ncbi:metallophosphoesterase family protein [candidate division WOR-3 bacterium]|nr:metallophosphoesterase family protein [candidate division WOR-3 bacterium]
MKLGIVSDIHANLEALEAVIDALQDKGATRFVCCGDIVGYGPDPNRCVEIVRELGCVSVAGNHDYGVVGQVPLASFNAAASQAALWTRPLLTEPNRLFLANLPLTAVEGPLLIVHSTPLAPETWEYVLTVREAAHEMNHCEADVCVVGHSHQPFAVERLPGGQARLVRQRPFTLRPDARYFINAGSVGQSRDGDPRACCMLYDDDVRAMAYLRIPYDVAAVQAKIRAAGLPERLAARLATGR